MRPPEDRVRWNAARLRVDGRDGHYESFFQRAQSSDAAARVLDPLHRASARAARPSGPSASCGRSSSTARRGAHVAVKERHPLSRVRAFERATLDVRVAATRLRRRIARRAARAAPATTIAWELTYARQRTAAVPAARARSTLAASRRPRASSARPLARYDGTPDASTARRVDIDDWVGSQNHNWGSQHTDHYAWGQVAGFDGAPDSFLECSSARLRVGPLLTPFITPIVLRLSGREHRLNALATARARPSAARACSGARRDRLALLERGAGRARSRPHACAARGVRRAALRQPERLAQGLPQHQDRELRPRGRARRRGNRALCRPARARRSRCSATTIRSACRCRSSALTDLKSRLRAVDRPGERLASLLHRIAGHRAQRDLRCVFAVVVAVAAIVCRADERERHGFGVARSRRSWRG